MQYKDILLSLTSDCQAPQGAEIMQLVKEELSRRYGGEAFDSWFKHLKFVSSRDSVVTLSVPTKFIREWITVNYSNVIMDKWHKFDKDIHAVEICVVHDNAQNEIRALFPSKETAVTAMSVETVKPIERQVYSHLDNRLTFDNFVTDKSNELALAAAQRIANAICPERNSNPLFLYGGVGLGKTHLMHAIAYHVNSNMPWKKVIYLTAENFMRQFIVAIKEKNTRQLQNDLRSADILMIDDVQFIGGKEYTQEEFFHTFNDIVDGGRQLVISADRSPVEIESLKDRIRSRLSGGLIVDICPTTFELRMGILQKKLDSISTSLQYDAMECLARSITSNVRELEGALNRLVLMAQIRSMPITVDLVQEVVFSVKAPVTRSSVSVERAVKFVADHYGIKVSDILSPKKDARIAKVRQVCMYIVKNSTNLSLADIGKNFGGRNHTTAMYSIKKTEEIIETDHRFSSEVATLLRKVKDECV